MKKRIVAVVLAGLLTLVIGGAYIKRRNQMAMKDQAVTAQWRQVNAFLQRRSDLIPSLLDAAKGYPGQERAVAEITKARAAQRAAQTPSDRIAANAELQDALRVWLAEVGKDRQLQSNEAFLQLQDELAGTENRIAVESRRYNDLVQDYNGYISVFPNTIFSRWAGFQRNTAYFSISKAPSN